jgi:hypothetical protein
MFFFLQEKLKLTGRKKKVVKGKKERTWEREVKKEGKNNKKAGVEDEMNRKQEAMNILKCKS